MNIYGIELRKRSLYYLHMYFYLYLSLPLYVSPSFPFPLSLWRIGGLDSAALLVLGLIFGNIEHIQHAKSKCHEKNHQT